MASSRTNTQINSEQEDLHAIRTRFRPLQAPTGGMRVAWSSVIALVTALGGLPIGWAIASSLYNSGAICAQSEAFGCAVLAIGGWMGGIALAFLLIGGWWFRLGWAWGLICVGLIVGLIELVVDPASPWLLLGLAIPIVAGLLTDPTPVLRPRLRRAAGLGLSAATVGYFVLALIQANLD